MDLQQHLQALREAVTESQEYLQKTLEITPRVTELLRHGHWNQAFDELREMFQGLICLNNFLETAVETLDLDLDELQVEGKPVRESLYQLNKVVKNMLGATETGDQAALGNMVTGSFNNSLLELKSIFTYLNNSYLANKQIANFTNH